MSSQDGSVTLVEYGVGSDPSITDPAGVMTLGAQDGEVVLCFNRNPDAVDLALAVKGTDRLTNSFENLALSTNGTACSALVPGVAVTETPTNGVIQVEMKQTQPAGQHFMRLSFEHQP